MSTTQENTETKAGHPPALKVGGRRVAQRPRRDSEDGAKPTKDKSEKVVDDKQSFNPFKPHALVTGIAPKGDLKDFPKDEIKHAHEKPVPSHQAPHLNKPTVIQQPRKQ